MVKTFDLSGKVILITGGYGYLGKAAVMSFLHHGANVYVLGKSEKKYNEAFSDHLHFNKKVHFQFCDISKTELIEEAFYSIKSKEGGFDVLINNAFYLGDYYKKKQSPLSITDEEWDTGIDGTLNSVFRCIRESVPFIEESGAPRIINISSFFGVVAPDFTVYDEYKELLNPPHYGVAKAGVLQLTKYYASYLGDKGITVNAVTPGPYPSIELQKKELFIQRLKNKTLLNRIGQPEDLAGALIFLASDAANYITGQNIIVDGGWTTV